MPKNALKTEKGGFAGEFTSKIKARATPHRE
jgi:hypothetical protein